MTGGELLDGTEDETREVGARACFSFAAFSGSCLTDLLAEVVKEGAVKGGLGEVANLECLGLVVP